MNRVETLPFDSLLPHRQPMLMLSQVVEQDDKNIHCTACIKANNPLLQNGSFPAISGLELLAQAAGALLGLQTNSPQVRPGAIVKVNSFQIWDSTVPAGSVLHIYASLLGGSTEAALFDGEVRCGEQKFFSASLMIAMLPKPSHVT